MFVPGKSYHRDPGSEFPDDYLLAAFNIAGQLTTTVMGPALASLAGTTIRKRWPSGEGT